MQNAAVIEDLLLFGQLAVLGGLNHVVGLEEGGVRSVQTRRTQFAPDDLETQFVVVL